MRKHTGRETDITGRKKMEKISVEGLEIIGKGVTATIYLLDEHSILKVFRDVVSMQEIQYEYDCAKLVEKLGIRTPAARKIVSCDQGTGIIYDRIKGMTLSDVMQKDKSKLYEYGVQYGRLTRSLHAKKVDGERIRRDKDAIRAFFDDCSDFITDWEKEEIFRYIDLVPSAGCLLHGDLAPVNIMVEDGTLNVIDVPTIMVGHPVFDLLQPYSYCVKTTILFGIYLEMSEKEKQGSVGQYLARFQTRYLDAEQSQRLWNGFLMGYFGRDIGERKKDLEHTLDIYYSIRQMGTVSMRRKFGDETVKFLVDRGRNWFRDHKDAAAGIDFSLF
jgi:uncharacterized protein (TIGR02172 family)